jgi:hypothetical protein
MIYDANLLQEMILLFALFFVISLGIYMAVRKEVGGKKAGRIYVGGEDMKPDDVDISPMDFYASIERTLRVKMVADLHNGDLSRYLIWMIMGMSVFMIILIWGMVL